MDQMENETHNTAPALVELRDVDKRFISPAAEVRVLKDISLSVKQGEFLAVVGKSGSGKSTLLSMITGIDRPSSGEVVVADTSLHLLDEGTLAIWRGRTIGVVFQFFQLLPTLTVAENIMLPMDFTSLVGARERRPRALELLDRVGIADQADKLPSSLSGGQQQRAAIARALANDPPVIVADEPTGNLDAQTTREVITLFESLVQAGKTVIIVTHEREVSGLADRSVVLADGQIEAEYSGRSALTVSVPGGKRHD